MAIYMWRDLVTTPWIYHNADLWLISLSSDGSTRYTIADKNLWATTVYNYWDTRSEDNCGVFYQWGNNYWFPYSWGITTSSTQVNAGNYWPWNYYNSSTFITGSYGWDSSNNNNLRWWTTWTNKAMQWPCANNFHIPTSTELQNIVNIWVNMWAWASDGVVNFQTYLKLPIAWYRYNANWNAGGRSQWFYWASTSFSTNQAYYIYIMWPSTLLIMNNGYRTYWYSIRPFTNNPIQPREWWTWTKLY